MTAAMLDNDFNFWFCINQLRRCDLKQRLKFHQNPSIFVRDTAIFRKSNMAAAAILNFDVHFRFFKFAGIIITSTWVQNLAKIEQLATKWQDVI